jgi:hypothetical protein
MKKLGMKSDADAFARRHVEILAGWVCGSLICPGGQAQIDVQASEHDFQGKPMGLRSYSAETIARYEWVDDKLVQCRDMRSGWVCLGPS